MHSNLAITTKIFFCSKALGLPSGILQGGNFHLFKKLESTFVFMSHISKVNPHVNLHFLVNGYNQHSMHAVIDQELCLHESM